MIILALLTVLKEAALSGQMILHKRSKDIVIRR